jgi:guanylate kinase
MSAVFVITGPSGVGKGTLIRSLLEREPRLRLSVSATTRPPRPGEEDGREYHFLTPEEFERRLRAGDFLEHATYAGNRYGTLLSEVEDRPGTDGVVLEIEVQGARQIRGSRPTAHQIFIEPPSFEALRARLIGRGSDPAEVIEDRLEVAREELEAKEEFAHVIVNDRLEDAVQALVELVGTILGPERSGDEK